jgi:hypothetical protein
VNTNAEHQEQLQGDEDERVIASIRRGRDVEVRVRIRPFNGRDYVDLRIFERDTPSRKGVTIRVDELEQIERALASARTELSAKASR